MVRGDWTGVWLWRWVDRAMVRATCDVVRDAALTGPRVLRPPARGAGRSRVRRLRGRSLPSVLRQDHGRTLSATRPLLPHAHGRVLRGDRQRARDRVALLGLILATRVPPPGGNRPGSGPFLAVEDARPSAHEVHERVFGWVLALIAERGLVRGERIGVDASTMETNAALRAIVRRDTGEGYRAMLTRMAQESGIATPTAEDLIRLDRKRTGKRLSNDEWISRSDPEARIARMKDGTTHLAYKPEHALDLDTGAVVAAEMPPADQGDTTTITSTLDAARRNLTSVGAPPSSDDPAECVADKGYHARALLKDLDGGPWKTRIAEPQRRGFSRWHGDKDARRAVYNNRTRLRSEVGQQAMRQRAELVERSFAPILDRGGMRRTWLRGRENVHKRDLIHVAGHNLGLLMRLLIGAGTPKEAVARSWCFLVLLPTRDGACEALIMVLVANRAMPALIVFRMAFDHRPDETTTSSTGC